MPLAALRLAPHPGRPLPPLRPAGLRLFFAVGPFLLSLLGPTALLIATILDISALAAFDIVPSAECDARCDEPEPAGGCCERSPPGAAELAVR